MVAGSNMRQEAVDRMNRDLQSGNNGQQTHHDRFAKEDKIVETFRRKLREAYNNRSVGEMVFRLRFQDGGVQRTSVGMSIEYEFTE